MNQMTPPEKTASIRSEARLHLTRLRQERLAKKRAKGSTAQLEPIAPVEAATEAPVDAVPPETEDVPTPVAEDPAPEVEEPAASQEDAEVPPVEDAPEPDQVEAGDEDAAEADASDDAPDPEAVESELLKLPGSGPGLVWMLEKCGVSSMEDLATADSERLKSEMGLVAKILDLDYWIDFARENRA